MTTPHNSCPHDPLHSAKVLVVAALRARLHEQEAADAARIDKLPEGRYWDRHASAIETRSLRQARAVENAIELIESL